jgi:hypothetical protein
LISARIAPRIPVAVKPPTIAVVIPVFNEEAVLPERHRFFILPDITLQTEAIVPTHAFFRELCGQHKPAFVFQGMHVYDLDKIST